MNKVILQGRLVDDPNIYEANEFISASFTLAINRPYKNKETGQHDADFISCQAYNGNAKLIKEYLSKGDMLLVEGFWRTGTYTKQDGTTAYTNKCQIDRLHFQPGNIKINNQEEAPILQSRTNQQVSIPEPVTEPNTIPQAFDADVDMSDEFPW